ncbi:MAG: hypothetical protein QW493_04425 [Candidatus Bathyarchaeia archaeon]
MDKFRRVVDNLKGWTNVMKKIGKPWGYEEVLLDSGSCMVKRLVLEDETSMHYHSVRNEVLIPVNGEGSIMLDDHVLPLAPITPVYVKKGVKHKIIPKQFLEIIEVSDSNVDDVIRISDKHKRVKA